MRHLDFVALELDFVAAGLDFVAPGLDFVAPDLESRPCRLGVIRDRRAH
jgi:hypothetical protein